MPQKACLSGLPAEIRQKIFSFAIQPNDPQKTDPENRWLTENLPDLVAIDYSGEDPPKLIGPLERMCGHALMLVSRTFHQEAGPLLYQRHGFFLFNNSDWRMWWQIQPLLSLPSVELQQAKHPTPTGFAWIQELAFQPPPELSVEFVQAIQSKFPSLRTLRAFRRIYLREPDGGLTGKLPDVWLEFHRVVSRAALMVTQNHPTLKHAKWSDWRFFLYNNEDSIRTMTVKLTADNVLSANEV
jgi:hypothetical protein